MKCILIIGDEEFLYVWMHNFLADTIDYPLTDILWKDAFEEFKPST